MNISSPNQNLPKAPEGYALAFIHAGGGFLVLDYFRGKDHIAFYLNSEGRLVLTQEYEEKQKRKPKFVEKEEAQFHEEQVIVGTLKKLTIEVPLL